MSPYRTPVVRARETRGILAALLAFTISLAMTIALDTYGHRVPQQDSFVWDRSVR
jgi:hypothetical protein